MTRLVIFYTLMLCGVLAAPPNDVDDSLALSEYATGNHLFTANLYKEIIKNENGNLIMSPFSAQVILALLNEGAKGATSEELQAGLSLPKSKQAIQNALKVFLPKLLTSEQNLKLLSANKIYVGKDVKLKEGFNEVATTIYNAGAENIDFASATAASIINQWVEAKTNNKIRNLIGPMDLHSDTKLVLVNTLYFKGEWENDFKSFQTRQDNFYRSKEYVKKIDMMQQTESFKYYENEKLNTKFIELPYKGANISMVIALPNEIEGISKLEENIAEVLAPQPLTDQRVELRIPKFEIEKEIQLRPILQQLGIRKIFNLESDLSGLTSTHPEGLYVDKVIQKSFIKVDEKGTEAASATAVTIMYMSAPRPPKRFFIADHPFVYYIKYNNIILFTGRYQY